MSELDTTRRAFLSVPLRTLRRALVDERDQVQPDTRDRVAEAAASGIERPPLVATGGA